jgi:hypothetical protein
MKRRVSIKRILAAANFLVVLLATYEEFKVKSFQGKIRVCASELSKHFWMKIRAKMSYSVAIVFSRETAMKKLIPVGERCNLYMAQFAERKSFIRLNPEDIKHLDKTQTYYFIEEEDFRFMNRFIENGLRAVMQLEAINLFLTQKDLKIYQKIYSSCKKAGSKVEMKAGGLEVRVKDTGPMREIYFSHNEVGDVLVTRYKEECEFLEKLKTHFKEFIKEAQQSRNVFGFIDSYVKSLLILLHETGVLKAVPDLTEYPELVSHLMPFKVMALKSHVRNEEPVVGGLVLETIAGNPYLSPLFDMQKVEELCRSGGRFIFTAWIRKTSLYSPRGYTAVFIE